MKEMRLKKSALVVLSVLQLLSISSHAFAGSSSDIAEITPIIYDTIAGNIEGSALFIDAGSQESLLSQKQWYDIQAYALAAVSTPNTESELRSATRFPESDDFNSDYKSLLSTFSHINKSGNQWNTTLFPSIISLAQGLANYSDQHRIFIQPVINAITDMQNAASRGDLVAAENNRQGALILLGILQANVQKNNTATQKASSDLIQFQADLTEQSGELDTLGNTFTALLDTEQIANLRDNISQLTTKIDNLNASAEHKKIMIGAFAVSPIVLLIGGSIVGAQLEEVYDELDRVNQQINNTEADLAHATSLAVSYDIANDQIKNIDKYIENAIGNVRTIQVHWQGLSSDLDSLSNTLTSLDSDDKLRNSNLWVSGIVSSPLAASVAPAWQEISDKANEFLQNAYLPQQ